MKKKLISIVVPIYNEEKNIQLAYEEIVKQFKTLQDFDYEIIFTDNHSSDNSFTILGQIALKDKKVKVIRFSRNFGFNLSVISGYRFASGHAAIQIDCDLQDPPSMFLKFIKLWMAGHDVVIGVRENCDHSLFIKIGRAAFLKVFNMISDVQYIENSGDFRLIDRSILNQLKIIADPDPFVRGLITQIAANPASINFVRSNRQHGKSKFRIWHLLRLAISGLYTHSMAPLKIAAYIGLFITLLTVILTIAYFLAWLVSPEKWPAGFATTTVLILFGISLNALFLGIIGEYVARIYNNVRLRPSVVVQDSYNIKLSGGIYSFNKSTCPKIL